MSLSICDPILIPTIPQMIKTNNFLLCSDTMSNTRQHYDQLHCKREGSQRSNHLLLFSYHHYQSKVRKNLLTESDECRNKFSSISEIPFLPNGSVRIGH